MKYVVDISNKHFLLQERTFLCVAISLELATSALFYVARVLFFPGLHPDLILIIYCIRTQMSQTMALLLIFVPKFWYQQKQVRNLAQEYSCRIPVDAFKVSRFLLVDWCMYGTLPLFLIVFTRHKQQTIFIDLHSFILKASKNTLQFYAIKKYTI